MSSSTTPPSSRSRSAFDGKIGDTSWTWDAHGLFGKTANVQGSYHEPSVLESSMALDAVAGPGGHPECRVRTAVQAGLAGADGLGGSAYGGGGIGTFIGSRPACRVGSSLQRNHCTGGYNPINPVSGLTESANPALSWRRVASP